MNVLVIENDHKTANDIKKIIEKLGHKVCKTAKTKNEAIFAFEEEIPNLIISEIDLDNEMDGLHFIQSIEQDYFIPVIFYTNIYNREILDKIRRFPVLNYLIKSRPAKLEELQMAVELAYMKIKDGF